MVLDPSLETRRYFYLMESPGERMLVHDLGRHFVNLALVAKNGKYIYIMVPKSGTSTVKYTLWDLAYRTGEASSEPPDQYKALHLFPSAPYSTDAEKWAYHLDKDCFTFTVVRNPFVRALSGYLDKKSRAPQVRTFREFLEFVSRQDPLDLDHHFAPQWAITRPDIVRYDAIIPLENFEEAFQPVLKKIFGRGMESAIIANKTDAQNILEQYYDEECQSIVENYYHDDFIEFGYSKDFERRSCPGNPRYSGKYSIQDIREICRSQASAGCIRKLADSFVGNLLRLFGPPKGGQR